MACGGASVLEAQGGDYDPSAWERAKGGEGILRVYVEGGRGAGGGSAFDLSVVVYAFESVVFASIETWQRC